MPIINVKLDLPKDDSGWDSTIVADLAKLFSDTLHTCFHDAITKITENGYSIEDAEDMVLKCGPFYGITDMVSSVVDRALYCLEVEKSRAWFTFNDLNNEVEYMMLEMVTMLRSVKPSLSVHEAMWTLLLCDLNVIIATEAEIDPQKFWIGGFKPVQEDGMGSKAETLIEVPSQDQETIASIITDLSSNHQRSDKRCLCCGEFCSRDALRKKSSFEKSLTLKEKVASLGNLSPDKKLKQSSLADKKNPTLPLNETKPATSIPKTVPPEPCKNADYYLAGIPYDESKGERVPRDDQDKMLLIGVVLSQSLQKEIESWNDWASVKVMQVAKRLSQDRLEIKKLKAKTLEKDKDAMEESTRKKQLDLAAALTNAQSMLDTCSSVVGMLASENEVLKREKEKAENQSLIDAARLKEAMCREQDALKKYEWCVSEKKLLEEELKTLKREASPKQQDLEKVKDLLKETKRRLAKEEQDVGKLLEQAKSMRNVRERADTLAKADAERYLKRAGKELKKCETEIKRLQYEIAALNLETETKKIAAMRWEGSEVVSRKSCARRECVMCLTDEMTVLFIPCGHQVLCAQCNLIHEGNGIKECPSCRTPVQKRINCLFC